MCRVKGAYRSGNTVTHKKTTLNSCLKGQRNTVVLHYLSTSDNVYVYDNNVFHNVHHNIRVNNAKEIKHNNKIMSSKMFYSFHTADLIDV